MCSITDLVVSGRLLKILWHSCKRVLSPAHNDATRVCSGCLYSDGVCHTHSPVAEVCLSCIGYWDQGGQAMLQGHNNSSNVTQAQRDITVDYFHHGGDVLWKMGRIESIALNNTFLMNYYISQVLVTVSK